MCQYAAAAATTTATVNPLPPSTHPVCYPNPAITDAVRCPATSHPTLRCRTVRRVSSAPPARFAQRNPGGFPNESMWVNQSRWHFICVQHFPLVYRHFTHMACAGYKNRFALTCVSVESTHSDNRQAFHSDLVPVC